MCLVLLQAEKTFTVQGRAQIINQCQVGTGGRPVCLQPGNTVTAYTRFDDLSAATTNTCGLQ